jgi:predicted amidohydrolase
LQQIRYHRSFQDASADHAMTPVAPRPCYGRVMIDRVSLSEAMPTNSDRMRVAAVQLCSNRDVERNLQLCEQLIRRAAAQGAGVIALPENFAYIGSMRQKAELAENLEDLDAQPVLGRMSRLARELEVWLLLGGTPTRSEREGRFLNTAVLFDETGSIAARYHKMHLFDIDIPGGAVFQESALADAGSEAVSVPYRETRLGLSICYDLRFPELYRALIASGCEVLFVPAAFTLHTGKDHWMPLLRARAIENLSYVIAPAQSGWHSDKRCSYGHSCVIDPWGTIVAQHGDGDGALVAELDLGYLRRVRRELPCLQHRRL